MARVRTHRSAGVRRTVATPILLAAVFAALAGCGSDDAAAIESSDSAPSDDSAPVTLAQLDGVVITVAPDDLAGELVRIDESGNITSGDVDEGAVASEATSPPPTVAPELVEAGVEPQDIEPELNPLGGDDPEDDLMPDVVCMGLQDAQNEIQDHGVFFSKSRDATGEGRRQLWDRNWIVVEQSPSAGTPIGEGEAVLSVVKTDEPNDC